MIPRGNVSPIGAKYHVVWVETRTDPVSGIYDVLWYDIIDCN